jgi:hypothetical protein
LRVSAGDLEAPDEPPPEFEETVLVPSLSVTVSSLSESCSARTSPVFAGA